MEVIYFLYSVDVIYVIGGGLDSTYLPYKTYEVIGVNIVTREVFAPADVIHAVYWPAAAASFNRLVVCGGSQINGFEKHCQLYSPKNNRYA